MTTTEQNREIQETVHSERKRLFDFIRCRVPSSDDADDILQHERMKNMLPEDRERMKAKWGGHNWREMNEEKTE